MRRSIHEIIRRIINRQVVDLVEASAAAIARCGPADLEAVREAGEPLLRFSDAMAEQHLELKRFLRQHLYRHYRVHRMSLKAQRIIRSLFEAFIHDPRILPPDFQAHVRELEEHDAASGRARAVADYIAGMTDRYAIMEYERVYNPTHLT